MSKAAERASQISKAFGAKLRALREAKSLTQQQLAEVAGLTREGVAQLETNRRRPQWETVLALAMALGTTCKEFMDEPAPVEEKKSRKRT